MKADPLTPDQAKLLAHVTLTEQGLGDDIKADAEGNPIPPEEEAKPIDPGAENYAMLKDLLKVALPAFPFLVEIYTDEVLQEIANAWAAVEEKHGWNIRKYMSVEVQFLLVAGPPTFTAVMVMKAYLDQKKAEFDQARTVDGDVREVGGKNGPIGAN
jgi:hypothetical protein